MQLVLDPPTSVGELAEALGVRTEDLVPHGRFSMGSILATGPLTDEVADVSAEYRWDIFHEAPVTSLGDLAQRPLVSYAIRLTRGRDAAEAALRALHGEPRSLPGRRGYGPFHVGDDVLEWYASEPDWAKPQVDLTELVARILHARTEEELGGPVLECDPPVPALALARALGCPAPVARSVDVHMSSWRMEPLHAGVWAIEATLDGAPGGDPVAGAEAPAASVRHVGEAATIRSLAFAPARD